MNSGFSQVLRSFREAAGLSLDALAQRAHCGKSTIGHAENGIRMPGLDIVRSLDEALQAQGVLISIAEADHAHRRRLRAGHRRASEPPDLVEGAAAQSDQTAHAGIVIRLRIEGREVEVTLNRRALLKGGMTLLADAFALDEPKYLSRALGDPAKAVLLDSPASVEQSLTAMRAQWHDLVRTGNLLGPRGALASVRDQIALIEALLGAAKGRDRDEAISLGAQYAESAAWLSEESGNMAQAKMWTSRAIEWAYEADDKLMLAWTMYRRSQQATAARDGAYAVALAEAGLRNERDLPQPMRAAIKVQQAMGYALEDEPAKAHRLLDQAHKCAGNGAGNDGRSRHGSFCTESYIEVSRANCLLTLGQAASAVPILEAAIPTVPKIYQRDKAAALSLAARAYAVIGSLEQAAFSASAALPFARMAGSRRIASDIEVVARSLTTHRTVPGVRDLLDHLADGAE